MNFSDNSPINSRASRRQNIALTHCARMSLLIIYAIVIKHLIGLGNETRCTWKILK